MKSMLLHARWLWWLLLAVTVVAWISIRHIRTRTLPMRPSLPTLAPITARDRVLVLAPHEDDEALATGGLIQQAVAAGARIRVVYLTNGDHNQLAFLLYRKRPWLTPADNRQMGEIRRGEAIAAMASLGVPERDLVFLGYPDHDTLKIWEEYWGTSRPLLSILTATTHVPYLSAIGYGKPYKGESIAGDVGRQLLEFRPTRVFVSHPADGNPDHRAYYLFLRGALLHLAGGIPSPLVYTYPVHMGPWPRPHAYHPDEWLSFPNRIACDAPRAWILTLTPEKVQCKYEAICKYRSQMTDSASWLTAFARRDEIFILDEPVPLREGAGWVGGCGASATPDTAAYETDEPISHMEGVAFSRSSEGMVIRITARRLLDAEMGLSVLLFGFRQGTLFADMPKLRIEWILGSVHVHDRGTLLRDTGIRAERDEKTFTFIVPWTALGNPTSVFAQVFGMVRGVATSQTGWQLFTLAGTEQRQPQ